MRLSNLQDMTSTLRDKALDVLTDLSASSDCAETVVVVRSPRSGTTWLAEHFREWKEFKFLNRPLYLHSHPEAEKAGFGWRTPIAPDEEALWAERYLEKALTGRLSNGWHLTHTSSLGKAWEHATRRKVVVKFCRAHRLIHWLAGHFPVKGIVFIVRHPCAVLASMMNHGAWDDITFEAGDPRDVALIATLPRTVQNRVLDRLPTIETRTEAFAATWCVDHFIPFYQHAEHGYPWLITSYEQMLLNGAQEMQRIADILGKNFTARIRESFGEASSSASESLKTQDHARQLSKWKSQLSGTQIESILGICEAFGIDFYTDEVLPNYSRLSRFQADDLPMIS
jgi:hypothetical protein